MASLFCLLLTTIYAAEFDVTFESKPTGLITSGHRILRGKISIPDMFIQASNDNSDHRRLREETLRPTPVTTPAPTTKLILPVITLIHSEGTQNGLHSLYGSSLNANETFQMNIFEQLKNSLVEKGKMAVIQFDKRNCKSSSFITNISTYNGPYPVCDDPCPNFCSNYENSCNLVGECYNDTNVTVSDLINDAKRVFIDGIAQIKEYLNEDIIDFNHLWPVPIGYSAQGSFIANYIVSKYANLWPTSIALMGSGIPINELLISQMNDDSYAYVNTMNERLECIKNGSMNETNLVFVQNNFLGFGAHKKYAKYWKDWMDFEEDIDYEQIDHFMAINSAKDDVIKPESFNGIKEKFYGNSSVLFRVYQDMNHYLVNLENWKKGKWEIEEKIGADIINYLNEINGYLDDMNEWILWNNSNKNESKKRKELVENDIIYKVLLYIAIFVIVLMMALCLYFIVADKVCPYEFEDMDALQEENERNEQREERRRRRRRRRHRRRRSLNRHIHEPSVAMIEFNEPMMIQSAVNPLIGDNDVQNQQNDDERLPAYEELVDNDAQFVD